MKAILQRLFRSWYENAHYCAPAVGLWIPPARVAQ
jgi:hypothetical protein